ncbi:MAG: T9SS type A sorting domain-containing protein, partial [Saprospiraceae bacterium]|nr:T9SS type A sorting domain-containing protein [Saprospiraceae bacterium]
LPDTSLCIHHPGVEDKRISFEFNPISYDPTNGDTTNILVNDWDIGTTEGGSSGSPLFNTKKQIIGQLEGGFAACGNDDSDSYGWFRRSWFGDGDSTNSLQYWLDPDGLGVQSINGRFCSYTIELENTVFEVCGQTQDSLVVDFSIGGLFMGTVNYTVLQAPAELDISFAQNSGMSNQANSLYVNDLNLLSDGTYAIIIRAEDANAYVDGEIIIRYNASQVDLPILETPVDGTENLSLITTFSIEALTGKNWTIQVSEDQDFNTIVFEGTSQSPQIEVTGLEASTIYYWRGMTTNNCGSSDWTEAYQFSTALLFCTRLYSNDGPFDISDGSPSSVVSTINFPYGITVEDVNIPSLKGRHSYVGDLEARLFYEGSETILFSEICDDQIDFNLGFDDQSQTTQINCPPTDQMIYKPLRALSDFNGKFAGGAWQMILEDLAFLDGGSFESWAIEVCFTNSILPVLVPGDHILYMCEGEPLVFDAFLDRKNLDDILVSLSTTNMESLISEIEVSALNEKKISIHVDDTSVLKSGSNYLILEARDDKGNLVSSTIIEVVKESRNYSDLISSPSNGENIKLDDFQEITFNSTINGDFVVEIATDDAFQNVVYTAQGNNSSSIVYNGSLPEGSYFLRVLRGDEFCADASFTVEFNLKLNTSTVEENLANVIKLFPNPFEHVLWIEKLNSNEDLSYRIFNAQGINVLTGNIKSNASGQRLDVNALINGVYFIEIVSDSGKYVERLVKL